MLLTSGNDCSMHWSSVAPVITCRQ